MIRYDNIQWDINIYDKIWWDMVRYDEKWWNVMRCDEIWWDTIYNINDDKIQYDIKRFYKII